MLNFCCCVSVVVVLFSIFSSYSLLSPGPIMVKNRTNFLIVEKIEVMQRTKFGEYSEHKIIIVSIIFLTGTL